MTAFAQSVVVGLQTDYVLRITIYEDEQQTQPRDLSGATAVTWDLFTDRPMEPTVRSLIKKSLGDGVAIETPATDGTITVEVGPPDQSGLQHRAYYHETNITDVSGNALRPTVGFIDYQA